MLSELIAGLIGYYKKDITLKDTSSFTTVENPLLEKNYSIKCRRAGNDRRLGSNPNYTGPVRRMEIDRRISIRDQRID